MVTTYFKLQLCNSDRIFSDWYGLAWTFLARTFYRNYLDFLLAPSTDWITALLFYLLFILGILVFVVVPGLQDNSLTATLL